MTRSLILCTALVALGACATSTSLPPAPVAPSASTAYDSLAPRFAYPLTADQLSATDAAVLNELAEAAPDETDVPAFDASRVRWDIDVRSFAAHPRVQYYLKYFQGFGRTGMGTFLNRGARYEGMIRDRFEAEGLPGDLGYLAVIESGYSSTAVSRAHAVGMWQFMRGTAKGYGLRIDSWVDERRDPVKATDAAARHLSDLCKRFGSLYLAAAAYNAGAGKVSRSLGKLQWDSPAADAAPEPSAADEAGDEGSEEAESAAEDVETAPDANDITSDAAFFRLADADLLAAETQDYVPKLIAVALIAKQPERYGFSAPAATPFAYDSLVVTDATGLDVIARLAGTSVEEIGELNPQYLRLATPPKSEMVIRLPAGTGPTVAARYAALPRSARVRFMTHVVRKHERLAMIASRYHLPVADIRSANPKLKSVRPAPGTRLVIPTVAVPSALAIRAAGSHGVRGSAYAKTYRVRRGDTLIAIARRYRVSVKALRSANAIRSEYALRAGMRLRIPG